MEGISHEACSLAGTLGLGKLIAFYDDNGISIDGEVEGWFTDDTPARFDAYGWQVIRDIDGHDPDASGKQPSTTRACETGTPHADLLQGPSSARAAPNKQGSEECHGAAAGCGRGRRHPAENMGWAARTPFEMPAEIYRRLGRPVSAVLPGARGSSLAGGHERCL